MFNIWYKWDFVNFLQQLLLILNRFWNNCQMSDQAFFKEARSSFLALEFFSRRQFYPCCTILINLVPRVSLLPAFGGKKRDPGNEVAFWWHSFFLHWFLSNRGSHSNNSRSSYFKRRLIFSKSGRKLCIQFLILFFLLRYRILTTCRRQSCTNICVRRFLGTIYSNIFQ